MAAQYIFNLSYHPKAEDFWLFLQEKVFDLPSNDRGTMKLSPSTTTGITHVFTTLKEDHHHHENEEIEIDE